MGLILCSAFTDADVYDVGALVEDFLRIFNELDDVEIRRQAVGGSASTLLFSPNLASGNTVDIAFFCGLRSHGTSSC